jgi:putative membrane protein
MSDAEVQSMSNKKSLVKGLLAGLVGGLVGTAAKAFAEQMFPPHTHGEPEPEELLTEGAGHALTRTQRAEATQAIRWGFGAAAGAAYGALAEYYPAATAKEGASFGLVLETLTNGRALPALGTAASPEDETFAGKTGRERASETTSHVVYGVVTETVRRFVRRWL